jgi:hypothetical protein
LISSDTKFYNLFVPLFIIFLKFLLPFDPWYNTSSVPHFLSENVIDPALSHIYDPVFQFRNFTLMSSFSCRFSVFQDPYLTWIPISYFRVHRISNLYHFPEMTILRKFFCVSFRGKRLKFSLLHHTSSDVKNEWCYISSHICLRHLDRYKSYFVLLHISDWRSIFITCLNIIVLWFPVAENIEVL